MIPATQGLTVTSMQCCKLSSIDYNFSLRCPFQTSNKNMRVSNDCRADSEKTILLCQRCACSRLNPPVRSMVFSLKKVLISEPVDPCCADILRQNGVEVVVKTGMKKDELLSEIQTYDGLVVRSATKVTADVIEAGKELRIIGRAGTGVDNIDCQAATRQGILVLNAPGGNTLSAAELTCAMIVSLSRNIAEACASMKEGKWDRKSFMGTELHGKTLAIIGLGRIGREVALRMQSFGMKTIGYDPLVSPEASALFGVESLELENIWPLADYITVHVPLIPQTKHLINAEVFTKCKRGVKVINCARGGIIEEEALLEALESGQCSGAGLDVYTEEPPTNTQLVQHKKVICTPHLGASTVEAQKRVAEEIALQFVDLMQGRAVPGIVNSPAFCGSLSENNRVAVSLSQSLGCILGSLVPENKEEAGEISLALTIYGQDLVPKQEILKTALLVGFLRQLKFSNANFVNAIVIAKDANIKVEPALCPPSGDAVLPSSVMCVMHANGTSHNVIGAIQGDNPVLSAIDGVGFENPARLSNNIVLCRGVNGANMTVMLLGALVEAGIVNSAHWSTVYENRRWCIVSGVFTAESKPESVSELIDFWAQLKL